MDYVLKCIGAPGIRRPGQRLTPVGLYLLAYDPEANDGQGFADWTRSAAEARGWPTKEEAVAAWQAIPRARPRRGDGQPNRPLTAFTMVTEARRG